MHKLCETGKDIRRLWTRFAKDNPKVMETANDYGSEHCELDPDALKAWKKEIERFLKVKEFDDVVLRAPGRFTSPLNAKLWEGWRKCSGDPIDLVNFTTEKEHLWAWQKRYHIQVSS